jgi:hypothetical protein
MSVNYRDAYKSNHLASEDLEHLLENGKELIFNVSHVKFEKIAVAGKPGQYNILYFKEPIKPLVLNSKNAEIIRGFTNGGTDPNKWDCTNLAIELYVAYNVALGKETTKGIRIKPIKPTIKTKPNFTEANFEKANIAKATIDKIKTAYSITPEIETKYLEYVRANAAK